MSTRELVYGRRPVREVLRAGKRQVLEILATERALKAEQWLRDESGLRVQVRPESALTAAAGTRDHQGVVAWVEPYRYADAYELAAGDRPLVVCLDQVTDPHNLGAVCRSAEGAGRTASSSRSAARRVSRRPYATRLQARSSTCRWESSSTSPATSTR